MNTTPPEVTAPLIAPAAGDLHSAVPIPRLRAAEVILVLLGIWVIYISSPIISSGDSRFVLPTTISIVHHGDADIDEYSHQFQEAVWVAWLKQGHRWSIYPIGVPWMLVPPVWVIDQALWWSGIDLEAYALKQNPLILELILASGCTAAAAAILYAFLRRRLAISSALLLIAFFAFGTAAYSSASRGLWQHGPSLLIISVAIVLCRNLHQWPRVLLLGLLMGYSYGVRPSNAAFAVGIAFVVWRAAGWRKLAGYAAAAVAGVTPLFIFHLVAFGEWFSLYYQMTQSTPLLQFPGWAFYGTLFSASRGLFVFSPFLLAAFVRLLPYFRRKYPLSDLDYAMAAVAVVTWVGVSRWGLWWGGCSYGPRLMCEIAPCLVVLLVPVVNEITLKGSRMAVLASTFFVVAGIFSIGAHMRGAVDIRAGAWCVTPVHVDADPSRVWDWTDPQFLRGLQP